MGKILALLLAIGTPVSIGCASLLPAVVAAVQDGTLIIDSIASFTNAYFATHQDPQKQALIATAIEKTRAALDAALRAAQGADHLDKNQIDAAFAEFRAAYADLLVITGPLGVRPEGTQLRASPGGLSVPEPLAIKLKV